MGCKIVSITVLFIVFSGSPDVRVASYMDSSPDLHIIHPQSDLQYYLLFTNFTLQAYRRHFFRLPLLHGAEMTRRAP